MLDHLVHVYEFREFGICVRQLEADEFQLVQCSCLLAHTHCGPSHHSLEPTRRETPTLALRILDVVRKKIAVIGFCSSEENPRWTCGNIFFVTPAFIRTQKKSPSRDGWAIFDYQLLSGPLSQACERASISEVSTSG